VAVVAGGAALAAAGARFAIVRRDLRRDARRARGLSLWLGPGLLGGTF
jgi:hypothetical protein